MTRTMLNRWLLISLHCVLLAVMVIAALRMNEAKASLADSQINLRAGEQLALEIKQLRGLKSIADEETDISSLSNIRIMEIVRQLGMNESQVRTLKRLVPAPIDGTDYQHQDVSIRLNGVTLEQVFQFLLQVEQGPSSAKATSLRLDMARSSGRETQSDERWNAQLTLTQLLYLARSARR